MSSGSEQRVAKRYAKALFEVTTPTDLDKVEAQLRDLAKVWETSEDFRQTLSNPRVSESARETVVVAVVTSLGGWATEAVRRTILTLVSLRKAAVVTSLSELFASYVSEFKKGLRLEITLAQPANEATISDLQKRLSSSLGGEVKMSVKTDPSLIGGLTVRLGDTLLDRSVAGTLQRVAGQLVR
jgi:F-type H+-transporting ATPase subunit delta